MMVWKCGLVRQLPTTMQINGQYRCIVIGVNSGFVPTPATTNEIVFVSIG
jgi:hypothetical protein